MFRKPKRVPRRVGRDDDEELQSRHGTGVDSGQYTSNELILHPR